MATQAYQDSPGLEPASEAETELQAATGERTQTADVEAATGDVAALDSISNSTAQESYRRQLGRALTGQTSGPADASSSRSSSVSEDGRFRARRLLRLAGRGRRRSASARPKKLSSSPATSDRSTGQDPIQVTDKDGKPMRRHGLRQRILHLTPSWFSVTMGTGVIASLLNLLPWSSLQSGLRWPALAFLLADILIFSLFFAAFIARYVMYPQIIKLTMTHPQQSMFLGTIPMGLVTIISGIALLGTNRFSLGLGFTLAASGLWWASCVMSLMTAIGVPFSMMTYQKHYFEGITASLLLPIVPPITVAASGAVLSEILMFRYPTYAFTIMTASYMILGIGLPLAMLILVLYFQRLLLFKSPPRDVIISVFLPLGPCGQGGEALLHLGRVALHLFPAISRTESTGVPQLYSIGQALYGAGLVSALLLFGLGVWWLCVGLLTLLRELRRGKLGFNMGWWGLTFPFASLALCNGRLAQELDSMTLKVTYTIFVISNLMLWFYVAIPTIRGAWTGRLFNAPCLADVPLRA